MFKIFDSNSECFAKCDVFCSHIFYYAWLRRKANCYQKSSKLWKNCIHQSSFENGWWGDAYPLSYSPVCAAGHKLQKPSKESGIFQSLGTISSVLFTKRQIEKGGPWPNAPLNTLLAEAHSVNSQLGASLVCDLPNQLSC